MPALQWCLLDVSCIRSLCSKIAHKNICNLEIHRRDRVIAARLLMLLLKELLNRKGSALPGVHDTLLRTRIQEVFTVHVRPGWRLSVRVQLCLIGDRRTVLDTSKCSCVLTGKDDAAAGPAWRGQDNPAQSPSRETTALA